MGGKKIIRCYVCNEILCENDDVHNEPKRDRSKKEKLDKNGNIIYKTAHVKCFEEREKKKKEWDDLYQYVLRTYYIKEVPDTLCYPLQNMSKDYPYPVLQECLESLEQSINRYMKDTGVANQKARYIVSALQNNIDDFYANWILKQKEEHFKREKAKITNSANNSTPLKPPTSKNKYDLSFLG